MDVIKNIKAKKLVAQAAFFSSKFQKYICLTFIMFILQPSPGGIWLETVYY